MRRFAAVLFVAFAGIAVLAPGAGASIGSVFADNPYLDHGNPDGVACEVQGAGQYADQRWCGSGVFRNPPGPASTVESFDGVPIDVNVAFPPAPQSGPDGPYPLMMVFHGYGGGKLNFTSGEVQRWLARGFAVYTQTNRGFHESCGTPQAKAADPDCQPLGFVRLNDNRAEVRDAQEIPGMLVDQGLVKPTGIGATGGSYGGGMTMALATLKDRKVLPSGQYAKWTSPDQGTPMRLAVALPFIPWTDLAYSLVPNGNDLDYIENSRYVGRFGVMKQSYVTGLYFNGNSNGYYAPAGTQPSGDLNGWFNLLNEGEPYAGKPEADAMLKEITTNHSSFYISQPSAPAPMVIGQGFTDDLFPGKEATRYYNKVKAKYPKHPFSLFFGSFGHARGQNGETEIEALTELQNRWADHYLKGAGARPGSEVIAYRQVCSDDPPAPRTAPNWASISRGEIRLRNRSQAKTVAPDGGDRDVALAFDPISGPGACAAPNGAEEPGVASYQLPPAPASGYTVMGSPTVIAKINQPGTTSQIAARLVDVAPDGSSKTLVNRELWRPAATKGYQVFQLQPNGWRVEQGHRLRLELLPGDHAKSALQGSLSNFGRPSNGQTAARISNLELRVPVVEAPGALGGLVKKPAKKVLPARPGVKLAPGLRKIGSVKIGRYR